MGWKEELNEIPELDREWLNSYYKENYPQQFLPTISYINKRDNCLFSYDTYKVVVISKDQEPYIHVKTENNIDIVIDISTGNIIDDKTICDNNEIMLYVKNNITQWLNQTSSINSHITNREFAQLMWDIRD